MQGSLEAAFPNRSGLGGHNKHEAASERQDSLGSALDELDRFMCGLTT